MLTLPGVLTGGCGSSNSTAANNGASISSTKSIDGLTLTLSENSSVIGIGQSVSYTLTVTNTSNSSVTYVPSYTPGSPAVIPGTLSYVTVTNTVGAAPLLFPVAVDTGTNYSYYENPVTLAPGATLTGRISSGEISQPGIYSATATLYIAVGNLDAAEAGSDTLLTTGPLTLTVR